MVDIAEVRRRTLELFQGFEELEDPTPLMALLLDAVTVVESYRHVQTHHVAHLPELTKSVDALLRKLDDIARRKATAREAPETPRLGQMMNQRFVHEVVGERSGAARYQLSTFVLRKN